jgi:hypothetical protein
MSVLICRSLRLLVLFAVGLIAGSARADAPSPAAAPSMLSRSIVFVVKIPSFDAAARDVDAAADQAGAVLTGSRIQTDDKGRKFGWLEYSVALDRLPTLATAAAATGKLYAEKFDASDQQSDYESLARRVDSLRRHEVRLSGILSSPRRMRGSDILFLQERLFRADVDAEMLLQQREDISRSVEQVSVRVQLFEPGTMQVPENLGRIDLRKWYAAGLIRGRHQFDRSLARGATGVAYAIAYAPIWAPLLILAISVLVILWRLRRRIAAAIMRPIAALGRVLRATITAVIAAFPRRHQE